MRNIGITVIILGALVTLGILASTTSAVGGLSDLLTTAGFYVWVMLPFVILFALTFFIHRRGPSPASRAAILLTTVLVVASSVPVYWASIFNSESSTSALVFIFLPLYALAAIAVVYTLSWLLLRLLLPRSSRP